MRDIQKLYPAFTLAATLHPSKRDILLDYTKFSCCLPLAARNISKRNNGRFLDATSESCENCDSQFSATSPCL